MIQPLWLIDECHDGYTSSGTREAGSETLISQTLAMCQIQSATSNPSSINTTQAARVDHLEPLKSDSPLTLAPDFEFGAPEH